MKDKKLDAMWKLWQVTKGTVQIPGDVVKVKSLNVARTEVVGEGELEDIPHLTIKLLEDARPYKAGDLIDIDQNQEL